MFSVEAGVEETAAADVEAAAGGTKTEERGRGGGEEEERGGNPQDKGPVQSGGAVQPLHEASGRKTSHTHQGKTHRHTKPDWLVN